MGFTSDVLLVASFAEVLVANMTMVVFESRLWGLNLRSSQLFSFQTLL